MAPSHAGPDIKFTLGSASCGALPRRTARGEGKVLIKLPDYFDCSNHTLARIDFRLNDSDGNVLNLHGNNWSFNIICVKVDDKHMLIDLLCFFNIY